MNKRKLLKDFLATHADELIQGNKRDHDISELPVDDQKNLNTLFDVAARVESALQPAPSRQKFESALKQELLATAHLRQAQGYIPPNPSRDLFILVAIIGFIVALGGILVALRFRSH
ncbi:MAG: hypothetical protein AAF485_24190 [Chloroflexota bacterium]